MPELAVTDIRRIARRNTYPQVSIHTPMVRAGREVEQNGIRLRNAADAAIEKLAEHGVAKAEAEDLLTPVRSLGATAGEMQHQQGGLSLFVTPSGYDEIQVPMELATRVEVGTYPFLSPLLDPVLRNSDYYILTLSLGGVGLYKATRFTLEYVELPDLPEDLCYVIRYDEFEKSLQPHMTARGGQSAGVHGHGAGEDEHEHFVIRFVDAVASAVRPHLEQSQLPLVLVGSDEAVGRFAARIGYAHLLEPHHHVDPHTISSDELLEHGWNTARTRVESAEKETLQRFHNSDHQVFGVHAVLSAITEGRAATVCVDPLRELRGGFDRASGEVHVAHGSAEEYGDELTNVVVNEALLMGVPVLLVDSSEEIELPAAAVHG